MILMRPLSPSNTGTVVTTQSLCIKALCACSVTEHLHSTHAVVHFTLLSCSCTVSQDAIVAHTMLVAG